MKIVLASASLGRKKILTDLGLKFDVLPAKIDERKITASNPIALVKKIAKAKAEAVCHSERSEESHEILRLMPQDDIIIIAADSMILFKNKTYGKPKDKTEARKFLKMLSGQTHEFITGLCVIKTTMRNCHCEERSDAAISRECEVIYQRSCKSRITFEKFTEKEISDYVKIANVTSFAGGFAPNLKGGEIIKQKMKIKGSVSNVLGGLPLEIFLPILKKVLPEKK